MIRKKPRKLRIHPQGQPQYQTRSPKMIEREEHHQSQPSQTLNQGAPESQDNDLNLEEDLDRDEDHQDLDDHQGMAISPPTPPPPAHDSTAPHLITPNPLQSLRHVYRRASKKRKKTHKTLAALEKKLQILNKHFQPIPFTPIKTLDFSKHEDLLKRLGLWDFVRIEFDRDIRTDLLELLIVNYNPKLRCSSVSDVSIRVGRADLARALKLPVKKDKMSQSEVVDCDSEVISDESAAFIEEFVSNWVLLHEDTWMMAEEVLNWTRFVKERQLRRVDWAGLIWFMVEKELLQATQLVHCYYASHLQCLMKFQKPRLFEEEPKVEGYVKEEEDVGDVRMSGLDDFGGREFGKQQIGFSLEQDKIESVHAEEVRGEDAMDFEECKEEEPGQWLLNGKNDEGGHLLRHCNLNEVGGLDFQSQRKVEVGEEESYDLSMKCTPIDTFSSADLVQSMETKNLPCSPPTQLLDHSSAEPFAPGLDTHMNLGGPSMLNDSLRREIDHVNDIHHDSLNDHHKRMRNDGSWDEPLPEFDLCMEQVQSWMAKARVMYAAREQTCTNAQINQQILVNKLEQRENMIQHYERTNCEERQKREEEIYYLERELHFMDNLLESYKKALKENRMAFSKYRERCKQPEEPLYKDVTRTGGVVLSTIELEKQCLERKEEDRIKRIMIEAQIKDFQIEWFDKLEVYLNKVHFLGNRLLDCEKEVKHLKEMFSKPEVVES